MKLWLHLLVEKNAISRIVQIPKGYWIGDDGSNVTGPGEIRIEAGIERLPWYKLQ
jgi:hypothetical protein